MSYVVSLFVFLRFAHQSHNMTSGAYAVFEFGETGVVNALENGGQHTRFREVLVNVLTKHKIAIRNPNEADSWTLVDIVGFHRVHISSNIEALNVVKDCFPLGSDVSVATNLADMEHINI